MQLPEDLNGRRNHGVDRCDHHDRLIILIATKLSAPPLWIASIIGLALMLWAFWWDDWHPLLKREQK